MKTTVRPVEIRPVASGEWDAAARVYTGVHPHDPLSGTDLEKRDAEQRGWGYRTATLLALDGVQVVGMASFYQNPGAYHPDRYTLELAVAPEHQGRGVGGALWAALEARLRALGAESGRVLAREDHPVAPGFLERRGFVPGKTYFYSALDVPAFDQGRIQPGLDALAAQSVRIVSLAELRAAGEPDLSARLHALMSDVRQDVPRSEPLTPLSFQVFEEAVLGDPGLLPGAYLVAVHGSDVDGAHFIGQTALYRSEASPDLLTGLTGVTWAWRGRGVALGLKLAAIRAARDLGAPLIRTDNASDNVPMLAINDRLGFVRDPGSVSWLWVCPGVPG